MQTNKVSLHALLAAALLALVACGDPSGSGDGANPNLEAVSRTLLPADPELAATYRRSCASCHTIAATRSPLTGDTAAWEIRMEKGMDTLVNNVVSGFGGMPPFGMCMDCDAQQFEALIQFMAKGE